MSDEKISPLLCDAAPRRADPISLSKSLNNRELCCRGVRPERKGEDEYLSGDETSSIELDQIPFCK
jgi:hypothetical protein